MCATRPTGQPSMAGGTRCSIIWTSGMSDPRRSTPSSRRSNREDRLAKRPDAAYPGNKVGPVAQWLELAAHNRSEEHTSELQSLMRISYAVFCLKKKKHNNQQ